jgi:hypothetical protein
MSKLQEKPSAPKREHPALFLSLCVWSIFALLDPDPGTDPGTPLNPDPDPHCFFLLNHTLVHNMKTQALHCKYLGLFLF